MSEMAAVLAGHQLCATWEDEAGRAIICTCGIELPTEPERGEIDLTFLAAHQAAALSAAGFGPVQEAPDQPTVERVARELRSRIPDLTPPEAMDHVRFIARAVAERGRQ